MDSDSKKHPKEEAEGLEEAEEDKEQSEKEELKDEDTSSASSEHTLDDLAEEDEDMSENKPPLSKKFEEEEDFSDQSKHIPHLGSLNSQIPSSSVYSSYNRSNSSNKLHVIILIIIGLAVILATVYLLKGNFNFQGVNPSPTPEESKISSTPTSAPSPTPTSIDRSKYKIRVLNGTGRSGLAASVSAKLKSLGYQIEKTANATNSAFTQTQVNVKDGNLGLIEQIIKDLTPDFIGVSGSILKSSDPSDGEVILGTK